MPMYEILVALGVVTALAADTLTVADWLLRAFRRARRWWRGHKRE